MKVTIKVDGQTRQFRTKFEAKLFLHGQIYKTFDVKKQLKWGALFQQLQEGKTFITDEI